MSEPAIVPYEASGGHSELRTYGDGEDLTIERQEGAIVVAWSAAVDADAFMQEVGTLVMSKARVQLSPTPYGRLRVPFRAARAAVRLGVRDFRFIAVDVPGGSFTWEARNRADKNGSFPNLVGEVGVATATLHQHWIARLIETTATPRVRADVSGIISQAQHLVSDEPVTTH